MKAIPLKVHEKGPEVSTVILLKAVLETTPEGGFTGTSEMRNRIKVLDKVEKLSPDATELVLEDEEVKILTRAMNIMKWLKVDKFIIDFEDSFK